MYWTDGSTGQSTGHISTLRFGGGVRESVELFEIGLETYFGRSLSILDFSYNYEIIIVYLVQIIRNDT